MASGFSGQEYQCVLDSNNEGAKYETVCLEGSNSKEENAFTSPGTGMAKTLSCCLGQQALTGSHCLCHPPPWVTVRMSDGPMYPKWEEWRLPGRLVNGGAFGNRHTALSFIDCPLQCRVRVHSG